MDDQNKFLCWCNLCEDFFCILCFSDKMIHCTTCQEYNCCQECYQKLRYYADDENAHGFCESCEKIMCPGNLIYIEDGEQSCKDCHIDHLRYNDGVLNEYIKKLENKIKKLEQTV